MVHRLTHRRSVKTDKAAPAGLPAPDAIQIGARSLTVGAQVCRSFAVVGYPAEVGPGWLEPLLAYPGRLDVAMHVDPVPTQLAADRLRRQLARLESGRRADAAKGRLVDPGVDAAAADAHRLAARLARGDGKLFRVGLYLTVHAGDAELDGECDRVRALAGSLLLDLRPATFRALQGWLTTLPLGLDQLGVTRTMDTAALQAAFPFASADLPTQAGSSGVLYGRNAKTAGLVVCGTGSAATTTTR